METIDILNALTLIHNNLMSISTKGEDSYLMVQTIENLRALVRELQAPPKEKEAS